MTFFPDIDYTSFAFGALWFMGTMALAAFLDIHITRWLDRCRERKQRRTGTPLYLDDNGDVRGG